MAPSQKLRMTQITIFKGVNICLKCWSTCSTVSEFPLVLEKVRQDQSNKATKFHGLPKDGRKSLLKFILGAVNNISYCPRRLNAEKDNFSAACQKYQALQFQIKVNGWRYAIMYHFIVHSLISSAA